MKIRLHPILATVLLLTILPAAAQTTAFTYQGRLTDGALPASGRFDMRFTLYSALSGGNVIGAAQTVSGLTVAQGLFTASLDFGSNFPGADRWLQIEVRPAGSAAAFTTLFPRQKFTSAPYAQHALSAAGLTGNISALQITSGLLDQSRLPLNIPRLDAANTFASSIQLNTGVQSPLALNGTSTGGTWLNLGNSSSAAATTWNMISTGSGNGEGAGKLLIRDADAGAIRFTIAPDGNVGIGTTSPMGALLDVEGTVRVNDSDLYLRGATDNNHGLGWYGTGKLWGGQTIDGPVMYGWGGGVLGTAGGVTALSWNSGGFVRVGSDASSAALDVTASGDKSLRIINDGFVPGITTISRTAGDPFAGYLRVRHVMELWPKADGSAAGRMEVRDTTGATTIVLNGGTGEGTMKALNLIGGADVAEPMRMPEEVPPGAAVVIDEDNPGEVKLSTGAYDTRVAGVVSGANGVKPGLSLRQDGVLDGGQNVALTGRVYALADAEEEPIKPGDLLVTSTVPGHVMKALDRDRSHGAILGKAMTPLKTGRGMVLVLVNLQ